MGVIQFTFDPGRTDQFIRFSYEVYRHDAKWIPPIKRQLAALLSPECSFFKNPRNAHRLFLATAGRNVIGRVAAFVNSDLRDRDAEPVGCVGLFECINDYNVARDLLAEAVGWLRNVHNLPRIWGPMNFDIWHGYRFMTKGFDQAPFVAEPYNQPYYSELFERFGFVAKQHWDSIEVSETETLEGLMAPKQSYYDEFLRRGYRFENLNINSLDDELARLHAVLTKSFSGFLGFTPISIEDFQHLFDGSRQAIDPRLFVLIYDRNATLIGFAGAFLELSNAVRAMRGSSGLLGKLRFVKNRRHVDRILFHLGGYVTDNLREQAGLGRAAFYLIMRRIVDLGFQNVILALMARGNKIQNMFREVESANYREYTLYELQP
jgi:hypothetical protein